MELLGIDLDSGSTYNQVYYLFVITFLQLGNRSNYVQPGPGPVHHERVRDGGHEVRPLHRQRPLQTRGAPEVAAQVPLLRLPEVRAGQVIILFFNSF